MKIELAYRQNGITVSDADTRRALLSLAAVDGRMRVRVCGDPFEVSAAVARRLPGGSRRP